VNLWTYWQETTEGRTPGTPPIIKLMLQSICRQNPEAVVLDDAKVAELGGQCVLDATAQRGLVHRSDLLRFWLLREFGGAWLDADMLSINRARLLPAIEEGVEFAAFCNSKRRRVASCALASQPGGSIVSAAYDLCERRCKSNRPLGWLETGPMVLWNVLSRDIEKRRRWRFLPEHDYYPLTPHTPQIHVGLMQTRRTDEEHRHAEEWYPAACAYHITNVNVRAFRDWSDERLFRGNTFLCFLVRQAFGRDGQIKGAASPAG